MEQPDVNKRVAAGAAYLDETRPGWERLIDLGQLDMSSCSRCVIGHVFGDYAPWSRSLSTGRPYDLGFTLVHDFVEFTLIHPTWNDLRQAWVDLLKERFDTGNLSDVQ